MWIGVSRCMPFQCQAFAKSTYFSMCKWKHLEGSAISLMSKVHLREFWRILGLRLFFTLLLRDPSGFHSASSSAYSLYSDGPPSESCR